MVRTSRIRTLVLLASIAFGCAATAAACSDDTNINPAGVHSEAGADAQLDAQPDGPAGDSSPTGTVKVRVLAINDFHGNLEAQAGSSGKLRTIGVIVPKVYWQYTSRRVITLEFIDGVNVDNTEQMRAWNVDRRALMETYVKSFWHQAFGGGLFHADPHPGNVFCTRDGRLAMLDFGMVKRLPENVRSGLQKELFGGVFNHPKLYADGLIEKGAMREPDRAKVEAWATKMFSDPKMRGMLFDHHIEEGAEMTDLFGSLLTMVDGLETFETPQDNLMFMRALGIVIDVCKEVVPEIPVSHIAMPVMLPMLSAFIAKNPEYAEVAMAAAMQLAAVEAPAA